jgi:hypothetical protein
MPGTAAKVTTAFRLRLSSSGIGLAQRIPQEQTSIIDLCQKYPHREISYLCFF